MLGWTLLGRGETESTEAQKGFLSVGSYRDQSIRMYQSEQLGLKSYEDNLFHKNYLDNIEMTNEGCYSTVLPVKECINELPCNDHLAMSRLRGTPKGWKDLENWRNMTQS